MVILIPAYKPDNRLVDLVSELRAKCDYRIVIVNDGSGESFEPIFDQVKALNAEVLVHPVNCGKGRALKTGFSYIMTLQDSEGVVAADADGQHLPKDILAVAEELKKCDDKTYVLGSRGFDETTPLRSRMGNAITRAVFALSSGNRILDTQTGLRGFPKAMLSWLSQIGGDRYEYEMDMLMAGSAEGYHIRQVPIDTVYYDENKGSHFSALRDAYRIYSVIGRYTQGSIAAFVAEIVIFCLLALLLKRTALSSFLWLTIDFIVSRFAGQGIKYLGFKQKSFPGEWRIFLLRSFFSLLLLLLFCGIWHFAAFPGKMLSSLLVFVPTLFLLNILSKKIK